MKGILSDGTLGSVKVTLIAAFLWICIPSPGQEPDPYTLLKVDNFDEIANREITSIMQDNQGFLWMGTYFGILKYDGNEVVKFRSNIYDPGSIPARKIKRLLQVGDTIWIGTIEEGKIADLVLIDGDLTQDIRSIRKMEIVFKDGVGFDSQKMFDSVKGKVGLY